MRRFFLSLSLVLGQLGTVLAAQVTIIYTGETHSMVYPCRCPKEPDGGIARRATLVNTLRKQYPDALLLDSGRFFAGGVLDENMQNTESDKARTAVNLKGMEIAGYAAAAIGEDEFNFGQDFLEKKIASTKLTFLSANALVKGAAMYLTENVDGVKVGVFALTPPGARSKAVELGMRELLPAASDTVSILKSQECQLIVLLTQLDDETIEEIINRVPGINIVIGSRSRKDGELYRKIGDTILLWPSWQGRRLGVLTASVNGQAIGDYKVESLRLSDAIKDDAGVRKVLPECFADINCSRDGSFGTCHNPGTLQATCEFLPVDRVNLYVISPKDCRVCNTTGVITYLKARLPGLAVTNLAYPGKEAQRIISEYGITGLPVFLLGREVENAKAFQALRNDLEPKKDHYLVRPRAAGVSYFLNRPRIKGKIDLFFSLFSPGSDTLLEAIRSLKPEIHFLCVYRDGKLEAAKGVAELEESLRSACVQKYYPDSFWDYLICRAKNLSSSWWEDCLPPGAFQKIKDCARSEEGLGLLRRNIELNQELGVMFGPTYLRDNYEIFSSEGTPSKAEFEKIFKNRTR